MLIYVTLSGLTFLLLTTQLFTSPEATFPVLLALKSTHKLVLAPNSVPKVPVALQWLI